MVRAGRVGSGRFWSARLEVRHPDEGDEGDGGAGGEEGGVVVPLEAEGFWYEVVIAR